MKVGDMVKFKQDSGVTRPVRVGLLVDFVHKKVHRDGGVVNWSVLEPERHGVILFSHNVGTINIPVIDLEVVVEQ